MADKKQLETSKIDALYSWISYDLQKMKVELLNELKLSSVQTSSMYQELKSDKDKSAQAIAQEIRFSYKQNQTIYDGLAQMVAEEVANRLNAMDEKISSLDQIEKAVEELLAKVEVVDGNVSLLENVDAESLAEKVTEKVTEVVPQLQEAVDEIKYSFVQHQAIYDAITTLITGDVIEKLNGVENKLELLQQLEGAIADVDAKITDLAAMYVENDYKGLVESVNEKTEETINEHSRQILEAVNAIPVAENVDYTRIVDEVGDKVIDLLSEVLTNTEPVVAPVQQKEETVEPTPVVAEVDYDKIVYQTAEKVIESLPYPEKINYRRIDDSFLKAVEKTQVGVSEEVIANAVNLAVEKALAQLDAEALANAVAEKIAFPVIETQEIDYDKLADMVAEKLCAKMKPCEAAPVLDDEKIDEIAERVYQKLGKSEEVDYARIGEIVEEKLNIPCEEEYNLVIDEEGVQALADSLSTKLIALCPVTEEPAQEIVEEKTEVVEEPVETPVEAVEEPVAEEPTGQEVTEELATTEVPEFSEIDNQLVDAETGLVIRLKKSFTAKMKQSDGNQKVYYSDVKNALKSYKRVNSNISWHGDRFNYGRDTVAKMNICGKTLCLYLALDPEDPEYKSTVYHQKNVGTQKAYESTPFMVKIKSDVAVKKAVRLVGYLAEKLGAAKDENFVETDYSQEFEYATTKELFDAGYIKVTKEKKVDLDF